MLLGNSIKDDFKHYLRYGNIITRIMMFNTLLFVAWLFVQVGFFLFGASGNEVILNKWLHVSSVPFEVLKKPWTILTYQFLHNGSPRFSGNFFHFIFNMVWLYWFGKLFMFFQNEKKVLPLYLLGGISGALLYILFYNVFPAFSETNAIMCGASASVMALVAAAGTLAPDYEIRLMFIRKSFRLKWLVLAIILLEVITISSGQNVGGKFSHLGGALFGFCYVKLLRQGIDLAQPLNRFFDWVVGLFKASSKPIRKRKMHKVTVHKSKTYVEPSKPEYSTQEKLDAILDKISESGYDKLTKEEKAFLFRFSNNEK